MTKKLLIQNMKNKNQISIYGDIGDYDYSVNDLKACLENCNSDEPLTIYINSYGGEISNGISMYNELKKFKDVTVYVQGVCMSIATVVAMASKKIVMNKGALFMIHKPLCLTYGNADDFKKSIEMLDKVEESILDIYSEHSKLDREQLAIFMTEEKFLNVEEAKEIFKNIVSEDEEEPDINDKGKINITLNVNTEELQNKLQKMKEEKEKEILLLEVETL